MTIETGQTFKDIALWLGLETDAKLVALSGADPTVGPYGWAVGGGHGWLTRMYGLGADALISL